jgi:hypothetical protein
MGKMNETKSACAAGLLLAMSAFSMPTAFAAPQNYTFDFSVAPDATVGSGVGNELQYYDTETGLEIAHITSWYFDGTTLAKATGQYVNDGANTGVGICNPIETDCQASQRGITDDDGADWMLIMFDRAMNLSEFIVTPDTGSKGKAVWADVNFYTGFLGSADLLDGKSYGELSSGLGLTNFTPPSISKTAADYTVDITSLNSGELWGNAILIGPAVSPSGRVDALFLNNISTVVPIPAAAWLLLSALGVLFGQKKLADRKCD